MNGGVGLVTYALDRSPGGIGRYTVELRDSLRERGVNLTVLNAGRTTNGRNVVSMPGAGLLPGLLTIGQVQIARAARRRGLVLVHDPTGTAPLMFTRAKRVITIHDVVPYIRPSASTAMDLAIHRIWLRVAAPHADAVITVSDQSKRDIARHLPVRSDRVHVVPSAAGPRFRPVCSGRVEQTLRRLRISDPYILFVGSLEPRKNLVRLLDAFSLRVQSWQAKLVIAGARKWQASPILRRVRELGIEGDVRFLGPVSDDDLPSLYSGAGAFVLPSLYEGFGLPVLEAMACGTPVVASNTPAIPEVAGDAAILVDPTDIRSIAHAIDRVLGDQALAEQMRDRGLAQASQFSWQRTARNTCQVYEKVLA